VALTLLSSHWTDKLLSDHPLFKNSPITTPKPEWMAGLRVTAQQIRDDRRRPPITRSSFADANFEKREEAKKRKHSELPVDTAYKNSIWLPHDRNQNDVVAPLVERDPETRREEVKTAMIICNKTSLSPDITGHPGFSVFTERVKKILTDKSGEEQQKGLSEQYKALIQGVTMTEHTSNVRQANAVNTELRLSNYIVVLLELPSFLGTYNLTRDFDLNNVVPVVVNESNMQDFFGDEHFVQRFKDKLTMIKNTYWEDVVKYAKNAANVANVANAVKVAKV